MLDALIMIHVRPMGQNQDDGILHSMMQVQGTGKLI